MRKMSDIVRNQDPVILPPKRDGKRGLPIHARLPHRRYPRNRRRSPSRRHLTGRDAVHRVLAGGKRAAKTTLAEVMTPAPHTMPPHKTAIEALRLMEDGRYRHLPMSTTGEL